MDTSTIIPAPPPGFMPEDMSSPPPPGFVPENIPAPPPGFVPEDITAPPPGFVPEDVPGSRPFGERRWGAEPRLGEERKELFYMTEELEASRKKRKKDFARETATQLKGKSDEEQKEIIFSLSPKEFQKINRADINPSVEDFYYERLAKESTIGADPWVDPLMTTVMAGGVGAKLASKAGFWAAAKSGLFSALSALAVEPIIGTAADEAAEIHPALAPVVAIGTGIAIGTAMPKALSAHVTKVPSIAKDTQRLLKIKRIGTLSMDDFIDLVMHNPEKALKQIGKSKIPHKDIVERINNLATGAMAKIPKVERGAVGKNIEKVLTGLETAASPLGPAIATPKTGTATLHHWSKTKKIEEVDPDKYGTGLKGTEAKRKEKDPENWINRSYWGVEDGGYKPEAGLGTIKYEADIPYKDLYDFNNDPLGLKKAIKAKGNRASLYERAIKEKGFKGYYIDSPSKGNVVALFEKVPVKEIPELRKGKYARSINVTKQDIPDELKKIEQEASGLFPEQKVQTWKETEALAKDINSYDVLKKIKEGTGLTATEMESARQLNVNAVAKLKEVADTSPDKVNAAFEQYANDIFKPVSDASSEAGRLLNIHKKHVSISALSNAFAKLEKGLDPRQLKEFQLLDTDNVKEVQNFIDRLPTPKLKDYVYEYWYNSILSGPPTHVVNIASNTLWAGFQLTVHRPLKAILDIPLSKLQGRERKYFLNETLPAIMGYVKAGSKATKGAIEMIKTGKTVEFESKWAREVGKGILGAFERSPHKILRKAAPYVTGPTRALRAMDVWANTMAYDTHIAGLARRASNRKNLKGLARKNFEKGLRKKPTQEMIESSEKFAKHLTFMDDPGKFTAWIIRGRGLVPAGRIVVPFVNTIANLTKRGTEMTPGLGLLLAKNKSAPEILAKQIEGAVIALNVWHLCDAGRITGNVPKNKAERAAFYRQGKKPWSIKMDDTWVQYRRVEPFNTVVASVAILYEQLNDTVSDKDAARLFLNVANGIKDNLLDSSYLQGVTNALDKHGRQEGMFQRTAASFVPYSSFFRSINRAYDVATEGKTLVRDTKSLIGAFSQTIPGLSDMAPSRLSVWGKEIPIEGGVFRQWLPYRWTKEKNDPTENMLKTLRVYPGKPKKKVVIGLKEIELPDDLYKDYCLFYGHIAKQALDTYAKNTYVPPESDAERQAVAKGIGSMLDRIREQARNRAKAQYGKIQ